MAAAAGDGGGGGGGGGCTTSSWEVPSISHFVWLFQEPLNSRVVPPSALELAMCQPQRDATFAALMTRLVLQQRDHRKQLDKGDGFTYPVLNEILKLQLEAMYLSEQLRREYPEAYEDAQDHDMLRPSQDLGPRNPLNKKRFDELRLPQRLALCNLLCDRLLVEDDDFTEHLRQMQPDDCRVEPFGFDARGRRYLHFSNNNCRVYRQIPPRKAHASTSTSTSNSGSRAASPKPSEAKSKTARARFELVCDSAEGLQRFMQSLNRKNAAERELHEQLELLLPDLVEVEEAKAKQQKANARSRSETPNVSVPLKRSRRLEQVQLERVRQQQREAELAETTRLEKQSAKQELLDRLAAQALDAAKEHLQTLHEQAEALRLQQQEQELAEADADADAFDTDQIVGFVL